MMLQDIEAQLLKLGPSERAKLAGKLPQSLELLSDEENEKLWAEEALRRNEELDAGNSTERPAEEVFRDARKKLKLRWAFASLSMIWRRSS